MADIKLVADFVQKHIAIAPDRLRQYTVNSKGNQLSQRWVLSKLDNYVKDFIDGSPENRWIVLPGLRGAGKTTLLAQLYFSAFQKYRLPQSQLLYVPADELVKLFQSNLHEFFQAYEQFNGQALEMLPHKLFVFIDETHYDKNWAITLKSIYDRNKNIFIICTGSSALALQTNPDIARRVQIEHIFPLCFAEYRLLKYQAFPPAGLKDRIGEAIFISQDASECYRKLLAEERKVKEYWSVVKPYDFENYLTMGSLPFTLDFPRQEQVFHRLKQVIDKVIYEDLTAYKAFSKEILDKTWKLLLLLANATTVTYDNLCNDLHISKPTLIEVLDALARAELIFPIHAEGSVPTQVRKPLKFCFLAPVVKAMLLSEVGKLQLKPEILGPLFEDICALALYRVFMTENSIENITYDSAEHGADFIVRTKAHKLPVVIEVGLGKKNDGVDQVLNTIKKTNARYGIVVADTQLKIDNNVLRIPKEFFLLI